MGQLSIIPGGAGSVQLANRMVLPSPWISWHCSWGLLVSTGAWGDAVQSRNSSLQPPGLWFRFRLMCYRPGGGEIVSLFNYKVRLMSWKSVFPIKYPCPPPTVFQKNFLKKRFQAEPNWVLSLGGRMCQLSTGISVAQGKECPSQRIEGCYTN